MNGADDRRFAPPDRWPVVRAPGKVMIAGEYGVLVGAPSLVLAVDRHVIVGADSSASTLVDPGDPLVHALLEEASKHASIPEKPPSIDDGAFRTADGRKLGLGSSAAKAAGLMAGAFLLAGDDLDSPTTRRHLLDAALLAHRRVGGGSGADVAASVLGGLVRYRVLLEGDGSRLLSPSDESPAYDAHRLSVPEERLPMVVHGGAPLSTRGALERLKAALLDEAAAPALLWKAAEAGEALVEAITSSSSTNPEIVEAVTGARQALDALLGLLDYGGEQGSAVLAAASSVAAGFGGAVKPSGAGAGDLVLVFVPSVAIEDRGLVASRLDRAGLHVLNLGHDDRGVRSVGPWPMVTP